MARIVDLALRYTTLIQRGKAFVGLCPIHGEKTPSFYVYPQTESWYCYGCARGGDAYNLVMAVEKCSFVEAKRQVDDLPSRHRPAQLSTEQKTWLRIAYRVATAYRATLNCRAEIQRAPGSDAILLEPYRRFYADLLAAVEDLDKCPFATPPLYMLPLARMQIAPDIQPFLYGSSVYRMTILHLLRPPPARKVAPRGRESRREFLLRLTEPPVS